MTFRLFLEAIVKHHKKAIGLIPFLILCAITIAATIAYFSFFRVPRSRLALDSSYPEMPANDTHRYIILPIDHKDPSKGLFKCFYLLSPGFKKGGPVVFLLTDGQMELVNTHPEFSFFDEIVPGVSYVLIGVRGQAPTFFPEVFRKDGSLDLRVATALYSSEQQIEDIEAVRLDMERRGDLQAANKVSIYGASGAGVLAQQYIARYGEHVDRAILEVTGAPDLTRRLHRTYARDFSEFNPDGASALRRILHSKHISASNLSYVLYQAGRSNIGGKTLQCQILRDLEYGAGLKYAKSLLRPTSSFPLARLMLSSPEAAMAKVRWYELTGFDLQNYAAQTDRVNLLYEFSKPVLADFISATRRGEIAPLNFTIERSRFRGETLVISGRDDVVFSPDIGRCVAGQYAASQWILLPDGHRMLEHRAYLQRLRSAFLIGGMQSKTFHDLVQDSIAQRGDLSSTCIQ